MAKRRTDKEIDEVRKVHAATFATACDISKAVNGDDETTWVHVNANNIGGVKAEYQSSAAQVIIVSYDTKDPILAERVARAIKAELLKGA